MLQLSRRILVLLLLLTLPAVFAGCDLLGSDDEEDARLVTARVIVGNGGNFSDQNGYLTLYDPETGETSAPAALRLNAFVQSMNLRNDRLYVTLNTTTGGRIGVVDMEALQVVEEYVDLGATRSIAFAGDAKAYVPIHTYTGAPDTVVVLDLEQQAAAGTLAVGQYPEGVAVAEGKAFVANSGLGGAGTTLTVIDTATDGTAGSIDVGCDGPNEVMVDDEGELVVVCTGKTVYDENWNVVDQTNGQVVFVNVQTEQVVDRIELDRQVGSANGSQGAYYSEAAEEAYVLAGDVVYRVDTDANALESELNVPATAGYVGLTAVAYDAGAERLYLGRFAAGAGGGMDPAARGAVLALDRDGEEVDLFQAGPSPSHIVLQQEAR